MFLDTSRYARTSKDTVTTKDGREATAIRLRALPPTTSAQQLAQDGDRLDVIAHRQFGDGTKFWHIADANTELEAKDLVAEVLNPFNVPES